MKTYRPGLRTEILLSLTLLLAVAMTLTSFVILRITERNLLRYKTDDGMAVVRKIQAAVENTTKHAGRVSLGLLKERLGKGISWMSNSGLYDEIVVVGTDDSAWVGKERPTWRNEYAESQIAGVIRTGKPGTKMNSERTLLTITAPIFDDEQCIAAAIVPVRIDAVTQGLSRSRRLIWFYTGLNMMVLVVFGNYLLSRIVVRPIKRLVRMSDDFEGTDPFFMMAKIDRNEITHLTAALNRMLKRLANNKERLEADIRSLETANLELKQAREEVIRSEKLFSLGRLAAGVAHEVGNPIGAILGYTNLLADHVADNAEARDYLRRVEKEITRIDTIIRDLLDFSRPSPSESAPVDVNALVMENTAFLARQSLVASVKIETQLKENVGTVWADANQLEQVLINLMLNACDAMDEGGSLTIAARRISPDPEGAGSDKEFIEVSVSDTGRGIAVTEINKIFDPFYTTKPPGKGTGLGLAISLRIIEAFGGRIRVESAEGKGSTFTVELPAWKQNHDTK